MLNISGYKGSCCRAEHCTLAPDLLPYKYQKGESSLSSMDRQPVPYDVKQAWRLSDRSRLSLDPNINQHRMFPTFVPTISMSLSDTTQVTLTYYRPTVQVFWKQAWTITGTPLTTFTVHVKWTHITGVKRTQTQEAIITTYKVIQYFHD